MLFWNIIKIILLVREKILLPLDRKERVDEISQGRRKKGNELETSHRIPSIFCLK